MFSKYFNRFLNYAVIFVLFFACIGSLVSVAYYFGISRNKISCSIIIGLFLLSIMLYRKYKNKINEVLDFNNEKAIVFIVIAALIIRTLWVIYIPTKPTSDFGLMFKYAEEVAHGQFFGFKGNSYFARFAHDTVTVLYFSLFYHFTNSPLTIIKILNIVYGTVAVYIIYLVIKEVFNKKAAVIGSMLFALFPANIMYTSEAMSENIAIPFYLLSVYLFIKALKEDKKNMLLFLCGISLSFATMFRMVGEVFLVAFIIYLLIYKGFKEGIKAFLKIFITFILVLFIVSQSLILLKITETQLWKSKEPAITSILKGTNMKYQGRWNEDDANIPPELNYDPEKIKAACKEIIIQRLTKTPTYKVVFHYVEKLSIQWGLGDFGAYSWSVDNAENTTLTKFMKDAKSEINIICNLIYITILLRSLISIRNREYKNFDEMNFFFILFGGFVLLYLITEMQSRYSFIAVWLIVIFALGNKNILKGEK